MSMLQGNIVFVAQMRILIVFFLFKPRHDYITGKKLTVDLLTLFAHK